MKRSLNILSLLFLFCAGLLFLYLHRTSETASAAEPFSNFPLNKPQPITFDMSKEALEEKSEREKLDQLRDWLLYAVVSDSGQSATQLGEILYDLPATREGYMHHVGNFEYGETRSRLVREGEVVALIPADKVSERIDQLAHIADEHRKNTGEKPESVVVFEYKLNRDNNQNITSGEITRRDTIQGLELFTAKYGYYETTINRLGDLTRFMQQTDDIVFGRQASGSLVLGGRKIMSRSYLNIRVEDVAAIWQSEQADNTEGSGFSLDPTYQFAELREFFDSRLAQLEHSGSNSEDPDEELRKALDPFRPQVLTAKAPTANVVSSALDRCDIEPLFRWVQHLRETNPEKVSLMEQSAQLSIGSPRLQSLEELIAKEFGRQQARYEGELRGTQVGMILFYTDLLAKLWDFNYQESIPREIDDFYSGVHIHTSQVSPLFRNQIEKTPWTRLWFGPDSRGFEVVDDTHLLFARKATKLFAKSKDTIFSTNEIEPSPPVAMFINWWDGHYEEVARYEPQYERLNEIMKWSLLISWLNQNEQGHLLGFLRNRDMVKRDYRFPQWARQQTELRFNKWNDDMFVPDSEKCVDTEALPLLRSSTFTPLGDTRIDWYLVGGVSLARKATFAQRTALSAHSKVPKLIRRSGNNYLRSTENVVQTIEGSVHKLKQLGQNRASFTSVPKPEATLRTRLGDLASDEFQHVLTSESEAFNIAARYGKTDIGNLSISRAENGFKIGWESRQLDLTQSIARKMSSSAAPDQVLVNNRMVDLAIRLPGEEGYLVKLTGSEQWIRLRVEGNPSPQIEAGWQARVADLTRNSKSMKIKFVDQPEVKAELAKGQHLVLRGPEKLTLAQNGLERDLLRGDYRNLARELSGSPVRFKSALEQNLNEALKRTDNLLANHEYDLLQSRLDTLIDIYGSRPELTIRRGIALIRQKETASAARTLNDSIVKEARQGRNLFVDEINLRLQNSTPSQEPLVQFVSEGKTFSANCQVKALPEATVMRLDDIDLDSGILYVELDPRLNHIDWHTNVQTSLKNVVEGELGEVIKLPKGDLSKFRPTRVYAEDSGKTFESFRHTTTQYNFRFPITSGGNSKCEEHDLNSCGEKDIYIVRIRLRKSKGFSR